MFIISLHTVLNVPADSCEIVRALTSCQSAADGLPEVGYSMASGARLI